MFDPEDSVAPSDTSSQDASKPGFQKAWNAWTSKPENNAALLQFGISMLQPRAPGQTGIGSVANSIGDAAGASTRVQEAQRAEELQTANIADKEANRENQATAAESGRITANAYDYASRHPKTSNVIGGSARFKVWSSVPEPTKDLLDPSGASRDPIVGALSKVHPDIKTKADILANPQYVREALKIFQAGDVGGDGDNQEEVPGAEASAPAGAQPTPQGPRIIYDAKGQPFNWDGIQGHPPVPVKK